MAATVEKASTYVVAGRLIRSAEVRVPLFTPPIESSITATSFGGGSSFVTPFDVGLGDRVARLPSWGRFLLANDRRFPSNITTGHL